MSATSPRTIADLLPRAHDDGRDDALARDAALVAGFAVLTAALAQLSVTVSFTPVPVTGQTLGVLLAGVTLGARRGAASMALYWVIGVFAPVAWYADDSSGASIEKGWDIATGHTAGYLFGFVLAAATVGYLAERGQDRHLATSIPAMLTGTAVIYACGSLWLAYDLGVAVATGEPNAISLGVTPFLIGDTIKLVAAGALAPLVWSLARD